MLYRKDIKIKCHVILHESSEVSKGLRSKLNNNSKLSFNFNGLLIACNIFGGDIEYLPLEEKFVAIITIAYFPEHTFKKGESFNLNIASRVIGEGTVISEVTAEEEQFFNNSVV